MKPAAAACPVMAAMVGIGRERSSATTSLKMLIMWFRRSRAAEREPAARAQGRSKPFEKNLPWEVVMRTEPAEACALTCERALRMELIKDGPRRWSSLPVRVRIKKLPRF